MKLKEFPISIFHTLRLTSLKAKNIRVAHKNSLPVIVTLTSIPSRLKKVHITIRSILSQSKPPKKIILWLNEKDQNSIPKSLKVLEGNIFEIRFTPHTCSHKKLIHTLELYPDDILITCDDDFIYDYHWLEKLYTTHLENPKCVVANHTRQIQFDENHNLLEYKKWAFNNPKREKAILAIGAGGVLYPPHSLSPITTNLELALELAPKADDLWFKAMSLLQGTRVIQEPNPPKNLIPVAGTQKISLKKENVDKNRNVLQWQKLTDYFNLNIE